MHLQEKVYVDLNGEGTGCPLGVIEPVAFGELTDWFHCIVVMRKHDRSPCRMVDLSHSLSNAKETHNAQSPFHIVCQIPHHNWKTVTEYWNGYHSLPLCESDCYLTMFIFPVGTFWYKIAPQNSFPQAIVITADLIT